MLKHETRTLKSQNPDGSPMYPGLYRLTWLRIPGGVWMLVVMERVS